MKEKIIQKPEITLLVLSILTWLIGSIPGIPEVVFKCISALLFVSIPIAFIKIKKNKNIADNYDLCAFMIIVAGFLFRAMYVLVILYNQRSHDLGSFTRDGMSHIDEGHLGYISYLYNHKMLPDFDPRTMWSYYNPPGFHILAAIWYGFNRFLGFSQEISRENIQILTLLLSNGVVMTIYGILLEFFPKNKTMLFLLAFVSFFPLFTTLSGSLNNDCLAMFLCLLSILYTIKWHKSHKAGHICIIALTVGLGMFTKINNAVVSIPIGFVFIYDMIKDIRNCRKYILQFALFLILCAPIALFWPIRNLVLYDIPFNYVQRLPEDSSAYLGNMSRYEYMGFPSIDSLTYPYAEVDTFYTTNLWIRLVKTSLLDGFRLENPPLSIVAVSVIFMWSGIIMWIMSIVIFIRILFKKNTMEPEMKMFFSILFLTLIISMIYFTIGFPFTCTMNFRYIVPMILLPYISLGGLLYWKLYKKRELKIIKCFMSIFLLLALFSNVLITVS